MYGLVDEVRALQSEIERLTAEKAKYHGRAAAYLIQRDELHGLLTEAIDKIASSHEPHWPFEGYQEWLTRARELLK